MELSWLKLSVGLPKDIKTAHILLKPDGHKMMWAWVCMMCIAMKSPQPGRLLLSERVPYNAKDIANEAGIGLGVSQKALKIFKQLDMISISKEGVIELINFSKHQSLERIEATREMNRIRVQRYRDNIQNKTQAIERDGATCQYCGAESVGVDHLIPTSKGGNGSINNLVSCCKDCNNQKKERDLIDFLNSSDRVKKSLVLKNPVFSAILEHDGNAYVMLTGVTGNAEYMRQIKSKKEIEIKKEIKKKNKEKTKISPDGEWVKTVLDPFWQILKSLVLLPDSKLKRDNTFHALRAILLRYPLPESQYILKDGEELARRWLSHIHKKGKVPLGENNRIRWAVGEIEMALEAIVRFGLARSIEDLEWAINDEPFWAGAFLSLKNLPMIQAKAEAEKGRTA